LILWRLCKNIIGYPWKIQNINSLGKNPSYAHDYVPEEAARCAGDDCGPQKEDFSDSGMDVERMFSRGGH